MNISEGNKHDCRIFKECDIEETKKRTYLLADKGYDSDEIRNILKKKGYIPIIAHRRNKKNKRSLKKNEIKIYKKRIIVENLFAWIKRYPKIDKIYEKKMDAYMGLLLLCVSIIIFKR